MIQGWDKAILGDGDLPAMKVDLRLALPTSPSTSEYAPPQN